MLLLQAQTDLSMSDELRQVAGGFDPRVNSYTGYDVNGYRFHTSSYEQTRPNRKTTNSGVFTQGTDELDYYGKVEEIYELSFHGAKPLQPVIFKCHWFDPRVTRRTPQLGLVEIRQDSVYTQDDVYIVSQQATQVYYTPYPCKKVRNLLGWYMVHKISPHAKLPVPNDEDYNFNPNTYAGEFFQEDGLQGTLVVDITQPMGMEDEMQAVVVDEDAGDEVQDQRDLEMLNRLSLENDNSENIPVVSDEPFDMVDSDDESYNPANPDPEEYF